MSSDVWEVHFFSLSLCSPRFHIHIVLVYLNPLTADASWACHCQNGYHFLFFTRPTLNLIFHPSKKNRFGGCVTFISCCCLRQIGALSLVSELKVHLATDDSPIWIHQGASLQSKPQSFTFNPPPRISTDFPIFFFISCHTSPM